MRFFHHLCHRPRAPRQVPQYRRYKSRLRRYTNDILVGQNSTFGDLQMFIDWPPKGRPPSEWTVPTGMRPPRVRIVTTCSGTAVSTIRAVTDPAVQRSRLETDHAPAIMGSPRPSFTRLWWSQSKHSSCCAFTQLLVQLNVRCGSLIPDRSHSHGHAP